MSINKTEKIWHNGKFIAWDDATVHIMSHVVNYGSSVFEGIRCYQLPSGPALFINVGVAALLDPVHDVDQMMLLLRWAQRRPEQVVLEITERELVRDLRRFEEVLARYRAEGFRFALDDVGEGHSTFEVLAAAVPEFIKISARFAKPGRGLGPQSAIRAAVSFAEESGAEVIAEGLEHEQNIAVMRRLGVTLGQGYALAKPAARWKDVEVTGSPLVLRAAEARHSQS